MATMGTAEDDDCEKAPPTTQTSEDVPGIHNIIDIACLIL